MVDPARKSAHIEDCPLCKSGRIGDIFQRRCAICNKNNEKKKQSSHIAFDAMVVRSSILGAIFGNANFQAPPRAPPLPCVRVRVCVHRATRCTKLRNNSRRQLCKHAQKGMRKNEGAHSRSVYASSVGTHPPANRWMAVSRCDISAPFRSRSDDDGGSGAT